MKTVIKNRKKNRQIKTVFLLDQSSLNALQAPAWKSDIQSKVRTSRFDSFNAFSQFLTFYFFSLFKACVVALKYRSDFLFRVNLDINVLPFKSLIWAILRSLCNRSISGVRTLANGFRRTGGMGMKTGGKWRNQKKTEKNRRKWKLLEHFKQLFSFTMICCLRWPRKVWFLDSTGFFFHLKCSILKGDDFRSKK